jgi:hypothetical protein
VSRSVEPSPVVLVTSPDPFKLRALLQREAGRRAMIVRTAVVEVRPGLWAAEVVQLRPLHRPWVAPVVGVAVASGVLAGAAAVGWWLLGIVAAAGSAVLGVLAVLATVALVVRSRPSVDVTVRVRVR